MLLHSLVYYPTNRRNHFLLFWTQHLLYLAFLFPSNLLRIFCLVSSLSPYWKSSSFCFLVQSWIRISHWPLCMKLYHDEQLSREISWKQPRNFHLVFCNSSDQLFQSLGLLSCNFQDFVFYSLFDLIALRIIILLNLQKSLQELDTL